jgi:hypothetical protein
LDDLFFLSPEAVFKLMFYLPGQYHTGYQEQMSHWPELPINIIMKWLKDHSPSLVVADFGCGESLLNSFLLLIIAM